MAEQNFHGGPVMQCRMECFYIDESFDRTSFLNFGDVKLELCLDDPSLRDRDSARIHTSNLSDFRGDTRIPQGRSLTVSKNLIAYRFTFENSTAVRILNKELKNRRVLKQFLDTPVDVQFATHSCLLAVVDNSNNLYVYKVNESVVEPKKYVQISDWPVDEKLGDNTILPRISWCPYAPENPSDPSDVCDLIAVFRGTKVHVINLNIIAAKYGDSATITYEKAKEVDAVLVIEDEENVSVVCISPDSTAVAVGTEKGVVSFHVINGDKAKFAHSWRPEVKNGISDLFFLDDISSLNSPSSEPERFWRHCVIVSNEGRDIALFECERWKRKSFVSISSTSRFKAYMDPRVRYVNLLDESGTVMLCLEIHRPAPVFASVTKLGFHSPLISIHPYDVQDCNLNSSYDGELEDDSSDDRNDTVISSYISLGTKALAQLSVNLEKVEVWGIRESDSEESAKDEPQPPQDAYNEARESARSWHSMDKDEIDQKFSDLGNKLDQLTYQVQRMENDQRHGSVNDNILQSLQQFREEFSLREDRLLANISDLMESNRSETIMVIRNVLNENSVAVQNSIQMNNNQASDSITSRVTDSLANMIVPSLDRICTQLFKQLNESFRLGMEQYMVQLRALHNATLAAVASATPAPPVSVSADRQALIQMIKGRQGSQALETVLNQGDVNALEFVINHLDPDEFFASNHLSQAVLISLCQQLSLRIESDTDLKFRYFEHILERLDPDDRDISLMVPNVLRSLSQVLTEMQTKSTNNAVKRPARVLNQIIKSLLQKN